MLVLYFGLKHWNYGKNLKENIEIPEGLEPYVSDYRINVFEISYLSDETVAKFRSDFRYVAELFTQRRKVHEKKQDRVYLTPGKVRHAKEVLELMKVMTGDDRFEELLNEQNRKGDEQELFEVFDIYENRGIQTGIKKGLEQAQSMIEEANARADAAEKELARYIAKYGTF